MTGKLVLENGTIFEGTLLGGMPIVGEVVFNTGMTGYQEILTDPSYADQIITLTYPLVGNYGVTREVDQSSKPYCKAMIVGELCTFPSNWQNEGTFEEYMRSHGIPCLYNVDTRAITRAIRSHGVMKGVICPTDTPQEKIDALLAQPLATDHIMRVTTKWEGRRGQDTAEFHVAMYDFGVKENILQSLENEGCRLTIFPAHTKAETVMACNPDGIFLSNGPGDPKDVPEIVEEIKKLVGQKPIFGICMGHQLIARAFGGETYKLRFGHRGSNHPVKDLDTNRVHITSQNHGYAVDEASLEGSGLRVSHRSVNDGTVEGLVHNELPIMSVQYHPEASPGPTDNVYLFERFKTLMRRG